MQKTTPLKNSSHENFSHPTIPFLYSSEEPLLGSDVEHIPPTSQADFDYGVSSECEYDACAKQLVQEGNKQPIGHHDPTINSDFDCLACPGRVLEPLSQHQSPKTMVGAGLATRSKYFFTTTFEGSRRVTLDSPKCSFDAPNGECLRSTDRAVAKRHAPLNRKTNVSTNFYDDFLNSPGKEYFEVAKRHAQLNRNTNVSNDIYDDFLDSPVKKNPEMTNEEMIRDDIVESPDSKIGIFKSDQFDTVQQQQAYPPRERSTIGPAKILRNRFGHSLHLKQDISSKYRAQPFRSDSSRRRSPRKGEGSILAHFQLVKKKRDDDFL